MRRFLWFLFVVLCGGVFALVAERTLIPFLASREPFSRIPRLTIERVTVVQPKEEIIIDREKLLERSVALAKPTLVRVERRDVRGQLLDAASGVTITADGIVATTAGVVGRSGALHVLHNGDDIEAEFLRYDKDERIALLRFPASGLPVVAFVGTGETALGASVFILTAKEDAGHLTPFLSTGVVSGESKDGILETDIVLTAVTAGAPLYTVDGKLAGIAGEDERFLSSEVLRATLEQEE